MTIHLKGDLCEDGIFDLCQGLRQLRSAQTRMNRRVTILIPLMISVSTILKSWTKWQPRQGYLQCIADLDGDLVVNLSDIVTFSLHGGHLARWARYFVANGVVDRKILTFCTAAFLQKQSIKTMMLIRFS